MHEPLTRLKLADQAFENISESDAAEQSVAD
jgi:hypothetical protein